MRPDVSSSLHGSNHAGQWSSSLATYAHPVIGRKAVDEITTAEALVVLNPI